ncbi:MAG: lipid-binding SYLF domain-containing protein [Alphaproteobacteria bacterium]|nr:lipid-binding SYLF domain-containing protein [Alphaproteobacteria bacterium]
MARFLLLALLALSACAGQAQSQTEQQTLVDRSTLVVQEMLGDQQATEARSLMKRAKGAMVCPRIFKAGFFIGGQGGGCLLVGRNSNGAWSGPAFYSMGSASLGLQIGVQDAEMIFIVLTEKGLQALLDSQFKFGADASVAVASIGAGVSGATTAALRADIVSFAQARGAFAGISLEGSLISNKSDWNAAYYGKPIGAQQIVIGMEGQNPGAAPLQEILARYAQ